MGGGLQRTEWRSHKCEAGRVWYGVEFKEGHRHCEVTTVPNDISSCVTLFNVNGFDLCKLYTISRHMTVHLAVLYQIGIYQFRQIQIGSANSNGKGEGGSSSNPFGSFGGFGHPRTQAQAEVQAQVYKLVVVVEVVVVTNTTI